MTATTLRLGAILLAGSMGCGSDPAEPDQLSVGGTYATVVALVPGQNTCTGVTVADNPTVVDHVAGATAVGLTHGGTRYPGQVQPTGQFTAGPTTVTVAGTGYLISLSGQFAVRGLTATVLVTRNEAGGGSCGYQVSWVGTKQGADNIIP